jgi:hypothetical protein
MEDGTLIIEFAFHMPSGTVTVLFPTVKKYYRLEIPADRRDQLLQMTRDDFFNWLWASGDYRQIGPEQVQGIEAVGFEVTDIVDRFLGLDGLGLDSRLVNFFLRFQSMNVRMWVDPEKRLPIQVEGEGEISPCLITGFKKMRLREVDDSMDYDVDLDESLFNPDIPEDFEQLAVPGAAKAGVTMTSLALAGLPIIAIRRLRRRRAR